MFLSAVACPPGSVVAGYWPMRDEADVRPLLEHLIADGCSAALPVVIGRSKPLLFRRWRPGDRLASGLYGTRQPMDDQPAVDPGLLLVPMLGFDRQGGRLGYGGGYYDRTLAALRASRPIVAVGVAFAAQDLGSLPAGRFDQRVDWIVTEASAWACSP